MMLVILLTYMIVIIVNFVRVVLDSEIKSITSKIGNTLEKNISNLYMIFEREMLMKKRGLLWTLLALSRNAIPKTLDQNKSWEMACKIVIVLNAYLIHFIVEILHMP